MKFPPIDSLPPSPLLPSLTHHLIPFSPSSLLPFLSSDSLIHQQAQPLRDLPSQQPLDAHNHRDESDNKPVQIQLFPGFKPIRIAESLCAFRGIFLSLKPPPTEPGESTTADREIPGSCSPRGSSSIRRRERSQGIPESAALPIRRGGLDLPDVVAGDKGSLPTGIDTASVHVHSESRNLAASSSQSQDKTARNFEMLRPARLQPRGSDTDGGAHIRRLFGSI